MEKIIAPSADAFDVDAFEDVSTTAYTVKNPATGQPTDIVLTLAGPEHPRRKKQQFDRIRKLRKDLQRSGKLQLADPVEEEQDETQYFADCILGWNKMPRNGKDVPYSPQAAYDLMSDPKRRWLRDQVRAALDEREAFIVSCAQG